MKRGLSLVLSVLMVVGLIFGGGPGMTVWADEADVPTNLAATPVSSSQINVSWSPVSEANGYELINADTAQVLYGGTDASFSHTDLSSNTIYRYQVRSYRVTGESRQLSALSGTASATTDTLTVNPPGAPTNFTATAQSTTSIRLNWTAGSSTINGYYVERKTAGNDWARIETINNASAVTFNNTGLTANTTYYYRIQAFNSGGASPYSNEANAATNQLPTVPAAPSNLTSSQVLADRVTLTWSDNSNNETGFRIERKTGTGSYSVISTVNANTTTYLNTDLNSGTSYSYRIKAYNTAGDSGNSNEMTITTLSAAPAAPSNLATSQVNTDRVTLTWKDNSTNETGFKIERKTGNGSYSEIATVNANVVTFTNTKLNNNTTYSYRVRAVNTAGNSTYSNEVTVTTASVPSKPDTLKVSSTGTDRLTITWRDNANNEKGFRIERKTGTGSFSEIATVNANVTSYTNTGLSNNATYTYRVRAYNDAGNSAYTNEVSAKTGVVLSKPDSLEVSSISTDRVSITWKDRSNNEKGFIIERKTDSGSYSEIATVRANTTSYTDTRLRNDTTYTYRIQAYNDEGRSEFSEELKITTGLVPDKPTELVVTQVSTDRISIEWEDNADNETGYRIERKTENGNFTEITTVRRNVTTYTNTGLRNRTEYTYRVRAYNDTGNSAFSNEVTTETGLVPEPPDRLTVTSEEQDRVSLSWRDRSDNENGFILERKTGTGSFTKLTTLSANTTVYTDRNLTAGQSYTYRVKSYNDSGESSNSNEVVASTIKEVVTRFTIGNSQYRVDGQLRQMDASPVIYESRTLLPIRYVAEAIGATVLWDPTTEKVTVTLDDTVVELWIGNNTARVNGVSTQIDTNNSQVKPLILPPGRTMMPLAFVSRSLGCDVQWNELTREVTVTYPAK